MLFERVKELAMKKDKNVKEVALELGFSENYFYSWKKGMPKADMLEKVANYFDVSVDYLLGRTDNPNLPQSPDWASTDDIMDLEEMLESNVNMAYGGEELTEEEKQRLKDVLTGIFWEKLHKKKGM